MRVPNLLVVATIRGWRLFHSRASNCVATIRGQRLFEERRYLPFNLLSSQNREPEPFAATQIAPGTTFSYQKWSSGLVLVAKFSPDRSTFGPFLATKVVWGEQFWQQKSVQGTTFR